MNIPAGSGSSPRGGPQADLLRIGVVVILVALLTGASFLGGFLTGSQVFGPGSSVQTLPPAPQVPSGQPQSTPTGSATSFDVFWDVWKLLEDNYYGQLPDEQHRTYGAIRGLLGTLDDQFTSFLEPDIATIMRSDIEGTFEGIGALVHLNTQNQLEIVRAFAGQPAAQNGLQAGDVVTHVDGKSIAGLTLYEAITLIRGKAGTQVTLTIERQNIAQPFDVTITRARIQIPLVESKMLPEGVAYISLSEFSGTATDQLRATLEAQLKQNPKGVVLDLRDNPGGLLREAIGVSDLFLPEGAVVIERRKDGTEKTATSVDGDIGEKIPLVVLVNGGSASASEIVAGALQDRGRAKLVGETTFGKGSVQAVYDLSDGSQLHVTIARWFTPNDHAIQGVGLTPDFVVPLTPEDAAAGRDPQLARAVEFILTGK